MTHNTIKPRDAAIAENIKMIRMLALNIRQAADDAVQCMQAGNRNGAIGALSTVSNPLGTLEPLWKSIQSLHSLPDEADSLK